MSAVVPLAIMSDTSAGALNVLGQAIGERRIVLLGENGHGVGEFTAAKVRMVRYLHEHLGFDVLAFESGFHECRDAEARFGDEPVKTTLHRCLIVQLHHAELLSLFEYMAVTRQSSRPLRLAGIDLQIQTFYSRTRPAFFRSALLRVAPELADTVTFLDSVLIEKSFAPVDTLRSWLSLHARGMKALYDSAVTLTTGDTQWTLRGASELMRREILRLDALARGAEIPAGVYEVRDKWMARSVARIADGDGGPRRRKVIVWLHNDHARYGEWEQGPAHVRATGHYLRTKYRGQVFSVGFFMGSGAFADNFRRQRQVATAAQDGVESVFARAGFPVSFLQITGSASRPVRQWAHAEHPYVRGNTLSRMRPGREYDALVYFERVSPPSYLR